MSIIHNSKKIHYVWVGDRPLPKLAKKCIRSWKKYLPDWEIVEWNEKNFNIEDSVPFVKQAYAQKKWAFVADYIRTKVLYEYGGIYFDTDMEVLKDINKFLKKPAFLGREYEGDDRDMACVGVMYFSQKNDPFLAEMLSVYNDIKQFNSGLMYSYSMPKVVNRILDKHTATLAKPSGIEVFDDRIWVYPKDYFYPVNYDWTKEFYSKNTVMVHHYDASWTGSSNKRNVAIRKSLPKPISDVALYSIGAAASLKHGAGNKARELNTKLRTKASVYVNTNRRLKQFSESIDKFGEDSYVVFSNPKWIGVSHVAEDMLGGYVPISEVDTFRQSEVDGMAKIIVNAKKQLLILNGLVSGWDRVLESIRALDKNVKIKILYHGGDVRLARYVDYSSFMKILGLHNMGLIDEIGFVKKQQAEFYKSRGFRTSFVANNVIINNAKKYQIKANHKKKSTIKIGLYCSGDIEWKNVFNQIAAVSMIEGSELDVVPINHMMSGYADKIGLTITGSDELLSREELFFRMANNDINLNVTFAEASPLLPLESMELGVPCITGNNHHYWMDTNLEQYLIVDRPDDIVAIYNQIKTALSFKDEIMKGYKKWKLEYNIISNDSVKEFLEL